MKSSSPSTKTVSKLTPEQQRVSRALGPHIEGKIGTGATPYEGQLTPGIPAMFQQAYDWLGAQAPQTGALAQQALLPDIAGVPAWQWDEGQTAKRWQKDFAVPAMETWHRTVAPMIRQEYAGVPGGLYSRERAQGVGRAAGDYFGQHVQPRLFEAQQADVSRAFASAEQAAARRMPAAAQFAQLPYQQFAGLAGAADIQRSYELQELSAQYEEFMRGTAERDPWVQIGMQYMGIPTSEVVGFEGQQSPFGPALLGAGAGALAFGGVQGAGQGALMALSDVRYKQNVKTIENCVDKVRTLRGCTFAYTEKPDDQRAGLIAQEVEGVLPEAVFEVNDKKFVDYSAVIGLLVGAINELADRVEKGE